MKATVATRRVHGALRLLPLFFLAVVVLGFGLGAPRFFSLENLGAVLVQSSALIVVASGMNFVLLTAGVDLSVGAAMYLAAVAVGMGLGTASPAVCLIAAVVTGVGFGALNGLLIVRCRLPPFIATLAMTFIGRGIGLALSSTKIVFASATVAALGRGALWHVPVALVLAAGAVGAAWLVMRVTPFGPYVRSIGADREGARRAGVPVEAVLASVYVLCGGFAGLGGFISLSQTSAASAAFGQSWEFLSIAAAVLGGTSLFGGRGSVWAPVLGAVLVTTVQNGLVMVDANPYAYPVITGVVIFLAALLDSVRAGAAARLSRRMRAA